MIAKPVAIVIPCLNEALTVGPLVLALRGYGRVIVVDDGSSDGTAELAAMAGATVVRHERPQGIGRAIRDGWLEALDAEQVAVLDAGGSHSPDDLECLLDVDADVVIGSRFVRGGEYVNGRWWRKLGTRLAALMCNLGQRGPWLRDWTSGYRVYSRNAVDALLGRRQYAEMHSWQIEVLGQAREMGLTVREAPITYRAGRSSLRLMAVIEAIRTWNDLFHHRGPAR